MSGIETRSDTQKHIGKISLDDKGWIGLGEIKAYGYLSLLLICAYKQSIFNLYRAYACIVEQGQYNMVPLVWTGICGY